MGAVEMVAAATAKETAVQVEWRPVAKDAAAQAVQWQAGTAYRCTASASIQGADCSRTLC